MPWGKNGWGGAWGGSIVADEPAWYDDPTYHFVSAAGNDDTGDGTYAAPWKTLAKLNSHTLNPGDTVFLNKGDTWREGLVPGQSGTSGNPITITSYGTGDAPIITRGTVLTAAAYKWTASGSGTNEFYLEAAAGGNPSLSEPTTIFLNGVNLGATNQSSTGWCSACPLPNPALGSLTDHTWGWGDNDSLGYSTVYIRDDTGDPDGSGVSIESIAETPNVRAIDLRGRSYFNIDGIHFNICSIGVDTNGSSSTVNVENCTFSEVSQGVILIAANSKVRYNTFTKNFGQVWGPYGYGDYAVLIGGSNQEIAWNTVSDMAGVDWELYAYGNVTNIDIHHNKHNGGHGFIEISSANTYTVADLSIYYNECFDLHRFYSVHNMDGGAYECHISNHYIANNTIVDAEAHAAERLFAITNFYNNTELSEMTWVNNCWYVNDYWHIFDDARDWSGTTHTNNLYYRVDGGTTNIGFALHASEIDDNPDFTDVGAGTLTLTAASPGIAGGTTAADTVDRANVTVGSPCDIGCYEYVAA